MAPGDRSARCQKCFRQHHKCVYSQPGTCDNCLKTGVECTPLVVRNQPRVRRNRAQPVRHSWGTKKCDRCRRGHKRCEPDNRIWPEKCHRCSVTGYPCSPARTGPEQLEHDIRAGIAQAQRLQPSDMLQLQSPHVGSSFELQPEPDSSSDSDSESDSNASVPAVLPTKSSKPEESKDSKMVGSDLKMKQTIQDMEAEFADVLKSEQARFEKIINELKASHERELKEQRERYEGRIDDLIQILKNLK
ncbi:hypothetical protein F4775DRAFT_290309 [Biscogniauxia sp. FL1348]|nr:hypothetical protein F4775DRAFT_290309 [Biscogniauxia sp. FL1348]